MSNVVGSFVDSDEYRLAKGIDGLVQAMFTGGPIPIVKIAGGFATAFSTYLVPLTPGDRVLVLSQTVDAILKAFNDHSVTDLLN